MEYIWFFMMLAILGAVLALWAVRSARPGNQPTMGGKADRKAESTRPADGEIRGVGDRLGEWVDFLLQQKRTVDDEDYRVRTNESLRALVEDRYARTSAARTGGGERRRSTASKQRRWRESTSTRPVRTPWGW